MLMQQRSESLSVRQFALALPTAKIRFAMHQFVRNFSCRTTVFWLTNIHGVDLLKGCLPAALNNEAGRDLAVIQTDDVLFSGGFDLPLPSPLENVQCVNCSRS